MDSQKGIFYRRSAIESLKAIYARNKKTINDISLLKQRLTFIENNPVDGISILCLQGKAYISKSTTFGSEYIISSDGNICVRLHISSAWRVCVQEFFVRPEEKERTA